MTRSEEPDLSEHALWVGLLAVFIGVVGASIWGLLTKFWLSDGMKPVREHLPALLIAALVMAAAFAVRRIKAAINRRPSRARWIAKLAMVRKESASLFQIGGCVALAFATVLKICFWEGGVLDPQPADPFVTTLGRIGFGCLFLWLIIRPWGKKEQ